MMMKTTATEKRKGEKENRRTKWKIYVPKEKFHLHEQHEIFYLIIEENDVDDEK